MTDLDLDALLACLPMSEDGTGHVADCGFDFDAMPSCECYSLPGRMAAVVESLIADRVDAALAPARELAEKWEGYAEACRLGMNNSEGKTSRPKMLWSVAADRLFDAIAEGQEDHR